nr:monovalent cation/H(+) antiporter subunit G [Motiliproteus sp. SC1-56]
MVVELVSDLFFIAGGFLCVTGGVGLLRFPDFFTRIHASGVTETLAAPLLLGGVMCRTGWSLDTAKLLLVIIFLLATNPTAAHAMARAALQGGLKPWLGAAGEEGNGEQGNGEQGNGEQGRRDAGEGEGSSSLR